jgi:DNA mismatch repair protein MutS
MVEMQEIAYILHNSTSASFIIIDEIGRGTSTYDGMSLAWAILQHNHNDIKAKTLFATHYHEIIDHSESLNGVSNHSVAVGEDNDNIVFLRKIISGGIKKSYGIEVAKLAGIPPSVLSEAKKTMIDLRNDSQFEQLSFTQAQPESPELSQQEQEDILQNAETSKALSAIDINSLSPLEALLALEELQRQAKK